MTNRLPSISSILCLFQGEASELSALGLAFRLARRHSASLRILHISTPPVTVADPMGAGAYAGALISADVIDRIVHDDEVMITATRRHVTDYAMRYGLRLCRDEAELAAESGPAALFMAREDYASRAVAFYAKSADIIVTPRPSDEGRILSALLDSGSAFMIAPPVDETAQPCLFTAKTVAVAWDGSTQAMHALECAVPLLRDVEALYLICVHEGMHPHPGCTSGAIALLEGYGIEPMVVTRDVSKASVGLAILEAATSREADLLVMGAYGHNHIAEALLGGTSRYVLHHADLPVLVAH